MIQNCIKIYKYINNFLFLLLDIWSIECFIEPLQLVGYNMKLEFKGIDFFANLIISYSFRVYIYQGWEKDHNFLFLFIISQCLSRFKKLFLVLGINRALFFLIFLLFFSSSSENFVRCIISGEKKIFLYYGKGGGVKTSLQVFPGLQSHIMCLVKSSSAFMQLCTQWRAASQAVQPGAYTRAWGSSNHYIAKHVFGGSGTDTFKFLLALNLLALDTSLMVLNM